MADISKADLKKEIAAILKDADLTTMSAKKVREEIEDKLDCDLSSRKKEVDSLVMQCLKDKKSDSKSKSKKNGNKDSDDEEGGADEEGEDEEEEEEGEEEAEEDASEEDEKPKRAVKKPAPKRKKGSSEESEEDDDKDSDDEYSPAKKAKGKPKGKGKGKKKKKGSDSDSDDDWAKKKGKKAGGGGKRGGGGYTKVCTLTPELAAVVGQDTMARHEVVKKVWSIIKEKNLYDPKNKQFAICNDELLKVFGVKRFRTFGMMKYLKDHFVD